MGWQRLNTNRIFDMLKDFPEILEHAMLAFSVGGEDLMALRLLETEEQKGLF